MLDFANRPPQGPEDVSLSEAGQFLLEDIRESSWLFDRPKPTAQAYGRMALTEVIEAYDGEITFDDLRSILLHVDHLASETLSGSRMRSLRRGLGVYEEPSDKLRININSVSRMRDDFLQMRDSTQTPEEVAAA